MRAALWGRDFEDLGRVGVQAVGERGAIAITRGLYEKSYPHIDANEDAVALVAGERATLLAVADGHNGMAASHRALQAILDELGGDPPADIAADDWLDIFARINDGVLEVAGDGRAQPASRTVLLAALVADGRVSWGSMGDAALVVATPGARRGRQLNRELMRFVGYPMGPKALDRALQRGTHRLDPGEWVVLATDGLSSFLAPTHVARAVPGLLTGAGPEQAASALIDSACTAGAGDNVAVAVLAPAEG